NQNNSAIQKLNDHSQFADFLVDCVQDKKGKSIVKLDLSEIEETFCDYFIICEGTSPTQVKAIGDHIMRRSKEELNERAFNCEGFNNCEWVLIDFVDIVIHVFLKEKRAFYQLETLWSDAKPTVFEDLD
ncbi:UNVERIFIED_CONTAM: hypothetical protein GTU68_021170, partial [Idotea baltica]|nr:hypothetical protein [Idotea baltica]